MLSDPEKRRTYDRYGKEGLSEGGPGRSAEDIFEQFFGPGIFGGGRRRSGPRKSEDSVNAIGVTLEDLYTGLRRKLKIRRREHCPKCHGTGTRNGREPQKCATCGGRGVVVMSQRQGMFIQQSRMVCPNCRGTGEVTAEGDACRHCNGKKVVEGEKTIELVIEPGMKENSRLVFPGESDAAPGLEPGDLIFILKTQPHERFQRQGNDLVMKKSIMLSEALLGCAFVFEHLDKRQVVVRTAPQQIIKPGDVLALADMGMPILNKPFRYGQMLIKFDIVYPLYSQIADVEALRRALPQPAPQELPKPTRADDRQKRKKERGGVDNGDEDEEERFPLAGEVVECMLQDYVETTREADHGNAYDSDSDGEDAQPRGVQCQTQ